MNMVNIMNMISPCCGPSWKKNVFFLYPNAEKSNLHSFSFITFINSYMRSLYPLQRADFMNIM